MRQDSASVVGTPVTPRESGHTPVFQQFHQENRDLQLWQGYFETYEQDKQAQFMQSLTKGPQMDFPGFQGEDPVGWIR